MVTMSLGNKGYPRVNSKYKQAPTGKRYCFAHGPSCDGLCGYRRVQNIASNAKKRRVLLQFLVSKPLLTDDELVFFRNAEVIRLNNRDRERKRRQRLAAR